MIRVLPRHLPSLAALALAGFGACAALGQDAAPAHVYAVGDLWGFDILVNGTAYRNRETIVRVDAEGIEARTFSPSGEVPKKFSPAMNALDENGKEILQVKHPLAVGKTWDYEFTIRMPLGNDRVHNTRTATVTATERIRVKAGEFECYRIEASGFYTNLTGTSVYGSNGGVRETAWYAPAVGRVIRHETTSTMRGTGATQTAMEVKSELRRFERGSPAGR